MRTASFFLFFATVLLGQSVQKNPVLPAPNGKQTQTALDYFRRADDLTNIRMPGSPPFHMKVTFHAFPGMDFAPPGQSTIQTGDGFYEEWWFTSSRWRREVTFGAYHAVEVRADGIRRFQATSDYEPSRVLMLLRALSNPIPRYLIEPQLEDEGETPLHWLDHPKGWKVRHLSAGGLAYVQLSWRGDDPPHFSDAMTWDLLPSGLPIRLMDRFGLVTSWQDQIAFAGRAVPGRFAVQAVGRDLVTASASVQGIESIDPELFRLSGDKAAACTTLRPFDMWDLPVWSGLIHMETPKLPSGELPPSGVQILTTGVIDRRGIPREVEITGIYQDQSWLSSEDRQAVATHARIMVQAFYGNRFRPALLDNSPCEVMADWPLGRPTIFWWGAPR